MTRCKRIRSIIIGRLFANSIPMFGSNSATIFRDLSPPNLNRVIFGTRIPFVMFVVRKDKNQASSRAVGLIPFLFT